MELLVVCTANVCRSPMAAAFLRARLPSWLAGVEVAAAGVLPGTRPLDPVAREVLAAQGLGIDATHSRPLTATEVRHADLVLCLERRHLRDVVALNREALSKSFTLRELVRRGELVGPRQRGTSLAAWLQQVGEGREAAALTHEAPDDDVADPTGGPLSGYEHTARWLDALVTRAVGLLFPPGVDDLVAATDDAEDAGAPAPTDHAEVQHWRHSTGTGPDHMVGIIAQRAGLRLARNVTSSLEAKGFELDPVSSDRWLTYTWAAAAERAAGAVTSGDVDAAVVLATSAMGTAALANRHPAVRAATPTDVSMARRARHAFGANVLCLGIEEVTSSEAEDIVAAFLAVPATVPNELAAPPTPRRSEDVAAIRWPPHPPPG